MSSIVMIEEEYPGPRLIETSAPCPPLARLPKLPVRVLVLSYDESEGGERRGLAVPLARLADELGVGEGVQVSERVIRDWDSLTTGDEACRYDGVFLVAPSLPGAYDDPNEPSDELVDALSSLLADSETRFLVLQPSKSDLDTPDRRDALCLRLAERGSPPAVVVPADWSAPESERFSALLFERLLHDSPLARAVSDAGGGLQPPATIYQPPGRRHGLDLGRLLEDHRRRIEEGGSALRMFVRELEAVRPREGEPEGSWSQTADRASKAQHDLEQIKAAVEEINRDRDPAGWSRLAESIARHQRWEDELDSARHALEATREAAV